MGEKLGRRMRLQKLHRDYKSVQCDACFVNIYQNAGLNHTLKIFPENLCPVVKRITQSS